MHAPRPLPSWLRLAAGLILAAATVTAAHAAILPPGFTETRVARNLGTPTAMAFAPDGRLFVCSQNGVVRVIKNGVRLNTPFLTLSVDSTGERGLLGIAFDPDFATNHFVYVYHTVPTDPIHNRITRYTASGDVALTASATAILDLNNLDASNHNGGAIHFGPDGKLYVAVGENATAASAQSFGNLLGKVLRLNANGTIPPDNPFFATATGKNRAIWARGLRNPFTFAFQPGTGRMFINDVGAATFEEINDGAAGANYGWPNTEGPTSNPSFTGPIHWYGHGGGPAEGCAITGGAFYNPPGDAPYPDSFAGKYFFADFCGNWIRIFDPATETATGFATGIPSPVDLTVGPDGSLYYLARGTASVWRVEFTGADAPAITSHPDDVTVPEGTPASFSVSASGTAPLAYQWQRDLADIPGANAATYTLPSPTLADDGAVFRAVVSNAFGDATSNGATLHVTVNNAPTATILSPAHLSLYSAGDTIDYSGSGSDPEDGALPASAFTWQVDFHHDTHTHPFVPATSGSTSGSFTIPDSGETATNVWYRIHLTVRDAGGLTHTTFNDVVPRVSTLHLATTPPGLQVTLDGQPFTTPVDVGSVVGMRRTLGAVSPQSMGETFFIFESWSDAGAATHIVVTPATDTAYTAAYDETTVPPGLGLQGFYYDNVNFTGAVRTRLDPTVDFDWGTGAPISGIGVNSYSVRWTGQVRAKVTGTHTFRTTTDGGVRLFVNGVAVIRNWTDHPATDNTGTVNLVAGQLYDIRLEYYKNTGAAVVRLAWSAPALAEEILPSTSLYPYALLVVGSTTLGPADTAVADRLRAGGFVPVVETGAGATAADANRKALVVISSTSTPTDVRRKFRASVTPVVAWESMVFDDLAMTGAAAGTSFGTESGQTEIAITAPTHPLAAGLSGAVTVTTVPATLSWGMPSASAVVVARPAGNPARASLFAYERGAGMVGLVAPGRRVGFFLHDATPSVLTPAGQALLDAALRWATGQ